MTWTYSGNPAGSDRDKVRFLIGDTDTTDQQMSDEEIAWLLTEYPSVYLAAANAAEQLVARYARTLERRQTDLNPSVHDKLAHYRQLAKRLRSTAATREAMPYAGGISVGDKTNREEDSDRVQPMFARERFSYPGES